MNDNTTGDANEFEPRVEDVTTILGLTTALYESIGVEKGNSPDWSRIGSLLHPGARFGFTMGGPFRFLSLDEFKQFAGEALDVENFREKELHHRPVRFGNIAHVYSTFVGVYDDGAFTRRGINSIQLMWENSRWWLLSIIWDDESPENPIPKRFLP